MFDLTALCAENSINMSYIDIGIVAVVLIFALPCAVKGLCGSLERGCLGQLLGVLVSLAAAVVLVFGINGVGPYVGDIEALDGVSSSVSAKLEGVNNKFSMPLSKEEDGLLYVQSDEGEKISVATIIIPMDSEQTADVVATLDKAIASACSDEFLASLGEDATVGKLLGKAAIKLVLFLAVFVIGLIVCTVFSYIMGALKNAINDSESFVPDLIDKLLGLVAGAALGVVIAALLTAILALVLKFEPIEAIQAQFDNSTIAKYVYDFVNKLFG